MRCMPLSSSMDSGAPFALLGADYRPSPSITPSPTVPTAPPAFVAALAMGSMRPPGPGILAPSTVPHPISHTITTSATDPASSLAIFETVSLPHVSDGGVFNVCVSNVVPSARAPIIGFSHVQSLLCLSSAAPPAAPVFDLSMPDSLPGPFLPGSYHYPIPDVITAEPIDFWSHSVLGGDLHIIPAQAVVLSTAQSAPDAAMTSPDTSSSPQAAAAQTLPSTSGVYLWWLIDRGANISIINMKGAMRYADASLAVNVPIGGQGKGQSTLSTRAFAMSPVMPNGKILRLKSVLESLETRMPILNESYLYTELGAHVHTPTSELVFEETGDRVKLHKASDGRLYMRLLHAVVNAAIPALQPETRLSSLPRSEPMTAAVCQAAFSRCLIRSSQSETPLLTPGQVDDLELASAMTARVHLSPRPIVASSPRRIVDGSPVIAAMRLGVSASGYEAVRRVCDGVGTQLSRSDAAAVDADKFRASSIARRKAAPKISIPRSLTVGCTCVLDGHGPYAAKSPHGGHIYTMHCVVRPSKYGFAKGTILHRQPHWRAFAIDCVVRLRALGVVVVILRFDRAGEFSEEFAADLERTLFVIVQMAPAKWHEGVGDAEINNDILTRMGEAMVRRAGLGPAYMSLARIYAQFLLNLRPLRGATISRLEDLTGVRPSLRDQPLITFGTTVLALREKSERGPHGSINNGRTYEGRMIGVSENSYMVQKLDTNVIVYPPAVKPLNEAELVNAGLPPSATQQSQASQTSVSSGSPLFARQASAPPLVPLTLPAPSTPTGHGIVVYQAMQGSHSLPDNLSARILARYPDAVLAAQLDVQNDRHGHDITARSARTDSYDRISQGDVSVAIFTVPSATFSMPSCSHMPTIQFRSKLHGQAMGTRLLPSAAKQTLMVANVVANYVCTAVDACERNGVPWMVDCSPDLSRHRCVNGVEVDNPVWSSDLEHLGTLWDMPRMKQLELAAGAQRFLVPLCALPMSSSHRGYIELMVSKALVPAAVRLLRPLACRHGSHDGPVVARGEPLPKELHDILAQVATEHLLPAGVAPPPCPPFSGIPRPRVNVPTPAALQASPLHPERQVALLGTSGLDALDDAYIAGDVPPALYDEALDAFAAHLGIPSSPVPDTRPQDSVQTRSTAFGCDIADPGVLDDMFSAMAASSYSNPIRRDGRGDLIRPLWLSCPGEVYRHQSPIWDPSAMKASQGAVDVVTDLGIQVQRVPATLKQLLASPDSQEWLMSDQRAHQAVLAAGNVTVRITDVPDGVPIAPCVTQRKLKI